MIATATANRVIVLAGNPNTGKSTLFNALTGGRVRVSNYPGVTVGQHRGEISLPDLTQAEVIDSPGSYSLTARSADEQIAIQTIIGLPPTDCPDLAVVVIDATQLNRNLYFLLQVLELNLPVVVALNMTDLVEKSGFVLNTEALQRELGLPVVPVVARQGEGIDELKRVIASVLHDPDRGRCAWKWASNEILLGADIDAVELVIPENWYRLDHQRRRALAQWALVSIDDDDELVGIPPEVRSVAATRRSTADQENRSIDADIIEARYRYLDEITPRFLKDRRRIKTITDRIDRVLLRPGIGFLIFLSLMVIVFQSLFSWADPVIGSIEALFGEISGGVRRALPPGVFTDFLVDGVIGGVGSFVVFLPQIALLFLFIGVMEDSGYMARVAVLMDRIMKGLRLHGRAFVPLLSGYACAVPAILATRTMERRRDRMLTMMVIPLMTCAARLPVYGLLIAAMVPPSEGAPFRQGLLMAGMYLFGTIVALIVAFVLGRTLFKGPHIPLLMEMPPYRVPTFRSLWRLVWENSREFLTKAGTIILLASVVLWGLLYFPRDPTPSGDDLVEITRLEAALSDPSATAEEIELRTETLDAFRDGVALRNSFGGQLGHYLEPVIRPLGFDWKIGIGVVSAFAAREVFVATMGVVYGVGSDADEESIALRERLQAATWPDGRKVFTPLVCLSLMIFFALACQCLSTLAVVQRETRSWGWTAFLFTYMTLFAWGASFVTYQGGRLLGFE